MTEIVKLVIVVIILIGIAFGLGAGASRVDREKQLCQKKGGVFVNTRSDRLCVKKEIVIPLE